MVAIINGESEDDGDIIYLGYNFNYDYHAQCLIDYAKYKYPQISGFENIDYMSEPNLPLYYLSRLNNIIFTNVSVDDEKRGMLYLPKKISERQLEILLNFINTVQEFKITIVYDLSLIDGMVFGRDLNILQLDNTKEEIEDYFLGRQYLKKERRI